MIDITLEQITDKLDRELIGDDGYIKLLPSEFYRQFTKSEIIIWANKRGIYTFPTIELVEWLKQTIGDRSAIELGAGHNRLGHYLGI
jgi:hypothetical protein